MDYNSYFIKKKALFGSYPTQEQVNELEDIGVRVFVNLTFPDEKGIVPYETKYDAISFPIEDRRIPHHWASYAMFIQHVSKVLEGLKDGELLYLHCKGGHGRAGIVVACLLVNLFKMPVATALEKTAKFHNRRSVMNEKWRQIGSPQTYYQKNFVYRFFEPLVFTKRSPFLSSFSSHFVTVQGIGTFPTLEAAYQAHKNITDKEYVDLLQNSESSFYSYNLGKTVEESLDWKHRKFHILKNLWKLKIMQNPDVESSLLDTGLRPLVFFNKKDLDLGTNGTNGKNIVGRILEKIRCKILQDCKYIF